MIESIFTSASGYEICTTASTLRIFFFSLDPSLYVSIIRLSERGIISRW